MSEYLKAKTGKLVLKGEKMSGSKKRKHKKDKNNKSKKPAKDFDAINHGGWWKVNKMEEITGSVAIEFGNHTYVKALDNGLFTLGAPHDEGEGPSPEEILTAIKVNDQKIALKSGYGKYLSVDKKGVVIGRSDAVGANEQWEPVFQDGKLALLGCNSRFVSVQYHNNDSIVALHKEADYSEFINIRSSTIRDGQLANNQEIPTEEKGSLEQVEENYVRKFQKFQDKKVKINTGDRTQLEQAKNHGNLHEVLLDRRAKMKSDRYCK